MDFLKLLLLLCVTPLFSPLGASLYEEPWGRDKQFFESPKLPTEADEGLLARTGIGMIRVHQKFVSPWDGPRSHFRPSSSQYTLLAMRRYGFFKGFMMGCSRLERENKDPWVYRTVEMAGFTFKEDIP